MQIKIIGQQPFQVLGTNFTIGPSEDGYDLMFSADGFDYSKLFSVGANTNRQVTQVAAGSYYFLSGNTGEVTVTWMANCGGEGGGGGYVLPVASENTLGGVKIGSGITIDENGAISSEGGGYVLPTASSSVLGGVKIGSGVTIDENGAISMDSTGLATENELAAVSAATSANTDDIAVLSALTNSIVASGDVVYDYDELSGKTTAEKQAIWQDVNRYYLTKKVWIKRSVTYMGAVTDVRWFLCYHSDPPYQRYAAVDGDTIYKLTFNANNGGLAITEQKVMPTAAANTKGGVKVGSGLEMSGETMTIKYGDGLGMSGDTLVVSGGTSGGDTVFNIYDTFANNAELANFLFQYWDENGNGQLSSGYPKDSTHIYLWLGQDFQGAFNVSGYGFVELQPQVFIDEEGMVVFLTGVYGDNYLDAYLFRQGYRQNGDAYGCYVQKIGDVTVPQVTSVAFGNGDIGGLSYNTSTGEFTLGGVDYASGDTTTPVQDVYDYNFVINGLLTRSGDFDDGYGNVYRCINAHTLYISDNGTDITLTSPSISMKGITSYTVDDIEFNRELTFNYGDWKLIMDVAESNVGINLRIQSV